MKTSFYVSQSVGHRQLRGKRTAGRESSSAASLQVADLAGKVRSRSRTVSRLLLCVFNGQTIETRETR